MSNENKPSSLCDKFQSLGIWFLPESNGKQLSGILEYDQNDISLTIIGSFDDNDTDFFSQINAAEKGPKDIPIILGLTIDGHKITLVDCSQSRLNASLNGISTRKFRVMSMFIGKHFVTLEEIKFTSVSVMWSNLHMWAAQLPFKTDHSEFDKIKVEYHTPSSIKAKLDEEFELKISHSVSTSSSIYSEEKKITQTTFLMIKSQTPHDLKEFWDIQTCFRHFLMLAMMKNVHPVGIQAATADKESTNVSIFPSIHLYDYVPEKSMPHDMLFHYPLISQNFESFVQAWRKFWVSCRDLLMIYFSTLLDTGLITLEIKFQRIAQVLEAYHRRKFPNDKKMSDEDYENMIKDMKSKLAGDKNQVDFVGQFKNQGNGPSLGERLQKLMSMCPDAFHDVEKEKHEFSTKVNKTRNYHAHGFPKSEGVVTDAIQLIYLTHQMMALAEACFLSELPFSAENLKEFIIKTKKIRNYARDHNTGKTSNV